MARITLNESQTMALRPKLASAHTFDLQEDGEAVLATIRDASGATVGIHQITEDGNLHEVSE